MLVKEAKTFTQKIKGLIGSPKPYPLLLRTRWGIHTFGMRYAIDVIILDHQNIIAQWKKNLQPNRIYIWNPCYSKVIELPANAIENMKLKKGKKLLLTIKQ